MDKFLDNWLPNLVVQGVFWIFDHPTVVLGLVLFTRTKMFKALPAIWKKSLMTSSNGSGDLVPDNLPSIGALSGTVINASLATAHLTAAPPTIGQFVTASDIETHRAVQDGMRFERNKMAALIASTENQGSPRVLLDSPGIGTC